MLLSPQLFQAFRDILLTPFRALYSKRPYIRAMFHEKGYGFSYILLLAILSWGLITIIWSGRVQEMHRLIEQGYHRQGDNAAEEDNYRRFILDIAAQLPPVTVKGSTLSIAEPMPYAVKDSKTGKTLMVIDTRQSEVDWDSTEASLFLNDKRLLLRIGDGASRNVTGLFDVSDWPRDKEWVVDIPQILAWLDMVYNSRHIFWLWGTGLSWLFGIGLACLVAGIFRLILVQHMGVGVLTYPTALRAASVALTPTAWMHMLLLVYPILTVIPFLGTIILSLPIIYLFVMFKESREGGGEKGFTGL